MILAVILILVIIIVLLTAYNISIHRNIEEFKNLNQKVTSLNIIQEFMDTLSECTTVDEKINKINTILIERYQIKYSTIVVYNGAEYVVKTSNVDKRHWDTLSSLQSEAIFQDSVQTSIPKYVTVENEEERLPYQKMEFGRAKAAMFFPLYIDNVYIGYWIIEGSKPHEFDNIDTNVLEVVRNNIVSVLRTVSNQGIIENIVRDDKFSGLKTSEYLYGEGRKIIDRYITSTVCMFKITNLEEINENISRKTGNEVITEICEIVKENLSEEYVFVRYMGPKFAIVFSGIETEAAENFLEEIKKQIDRVRVEPVDVEFEDDDDDSEIVAKPKVNMVVTTYYKGTALEGTMKKMEEYLDNANKNENSINCL